MKARPYLTAFLALCALSAAGVWHQQLWWWIEVHTGTVNEPGPYYGFWSGFGSDIGEYALVVGMWSNVLLLWRAHTCHYSIWCPRHGHYQLDGTPFRLCHRHHPDEKPATAKDALGLVA